MPEKRRTVPKARMREYKGLLAKLDYYYNLATEIAKETFHCDKPFIVQLDDDYINLTDEKTGILIGTIPVNVLWSRKARKAFQS